MREQDSQKIRAQLRKWQERLLDLTKANPLLGLNRSRVSKLRVIEPSVANLFEIFVVADEPVLRMPLVRRRTLARQDADELQDQSQDFSIEPGDIAFEAAPVDVLRRLRRIYDNARTTVEERGVTTLYLTFGTLHWYDEVLGESISPLWMVPCELKSTGPTTPLRLSRVDEEMQLNPALELYLRERHKVKLPTLPEEVDSNSLSEFLNDVRKAVSEQKWTVDEDVWLSTYTFESLVIYQDLKVMEDVAVAHPIIAALARAASAVEASERLTDDMDSIPTPHVVPVPILPTDSSQLEALTYAASGRNLVIHGPPGTGKSQTISNLMADSLGMSKKVLFVSAKIAALNVVYQRLAEKGLGRFCLEAHSTKAGKAKIIDELRRIVEMEPEIDGELLSEEISTLTRTKEQLNAYVQDLHGKVGSIDLTPYAAIGKIAKLRKAPELRFQLPWQDLPSVTRQELENVLNALADLSAQAAVFDARSRHPWRGFHSTEAGVVELQSIESDLRVIVEICRTILGALENLQSLLPSGPHLSLQEIRGLIPAFEAIVKVESLPSDWWLWPSKQLSELADMLEEASARVAERSSKDHAYRAVLDQPLAIGRELLEPVVTRFSPWYRGATSSYWRWRLHVRKLLKPGAKADFGSLRAYYTLAARLTEIDAWLMKHRNALVEKVGETEISNEAALLRASREFRAAAIVQAWLSARNIQLLEGCTRIQPVVHDSVGEILANLPARRASFGESIHRVDSAWPDGLVDGLAVSKTPLPVLIQRCEETLKSPQRVHEWLLLQRTIEQSRKVGLGSLLDAIGETSARLVRSAFERRFYTLWIDQVIRHLPHLATFSGMRREEQIQKFRELDEKIRALALRRIKAVASEPARRVRGARGDFGNQSEVGILRYELGKKRRIKPLRKLFAEIPHVLQALKPCMLMSPISVSTYLKPGTLDFDLVVFDEASQLPPAEAIPSILRAKQVIVAGDANQLPPTSFFTASLLAEEEPEGIGEAAEEPLEPLESLLDDCVAIVPSFQEAYLRWHYRSRDERLIKFSNHYIYNNRLITFPSSSTGDEDRGVRLEYISGGVWDRGKSRTNRHEARRVAELVVEHFERHPERSLGVVAMNVQQREAIEDAINEQLIERPDLAPLLGANQLEPFFVKALETVQGDERDTIIISVSYGRDGNGVLTYNFGPLNMEGGWRRLNVLVTRAKWQTIIVTSLRSHELQGINPQNRGAVALRNYIEYAEKKAELPYDPALIGDAETNDFEDSVREVLVERGLQVDQQVGASRYRIDLAIRDRRDPRRYVLGVECDGATYHSARTARDRDLLRQQVLREMGWRLHRVWSVDWFRDPEREIEAILRSNERAEAFAPEQLPEAPTVGDPSASSKATTSIGRPKSSAEPTRNYLPGETYRKYQSKEPLGNGRLILDGWNVPILAQQVADIVEVEGPIHEDLIAERLKELHGIERLGSNIQGNISQAIELAIQKHGLLRGDSAGKFISKEGKTLKTFRLPKDDVKRPVHLIPPEEIALAVLYLVEAQFGVWRDQIPQAVVRLFGFERARAEAADVIRTVVDNLVEQGALKSSGYQVYPP